MNDTLLKFGYPSSIIREYDSWFVLLRPKQLTLGSLLIVNKSKFTSLSQISIEDYKELKRITHDIEFVLKRTLSAEKFNYLALMMNEREVHFHVFPRYSKDLGFGNKLYSDIDWPGPPEVKKAVLMTSRIFDDLLNHLKDNWI